MDNWTWRVVYTDGGFLEEAGAAQGWASVEMDRVAEVSWMPTVPGLAPHTVRIDAASGQRPILFRRRSLAVDPKTGAGAAGPTIHALGWQRTVEGRNVASYVFIREDGSTVLTDDHQAV